MCMPDGHMRQIDLINLLAHELPNLEKQIPVVAFIHISKPPEEFTLPQPDVVGAHMHTSPNVLGVHTKDDSLPHDDPHANGSWVIRQLMQKLKHSKDLIKALQSTNNEAKNQKRSLMIITEHEFKQLQM